MVVNNANNFHFGADSQAHNNSMYVSILNST